MYVKSRTNKSKMKIAYDWNMKRKSPSELRFVEKIDPAARRPRGKNYPSKSFCMLLR